jgi:dTDP-4-dehydrorhamnose 3,5-epimerase
MEICATQIPDVRLITPARHGDRRGFLSEVYNQRALAATGIEAAFVQEYHTPQSATAGTVHGVHYQISPVAQTKLVRVTRGAILDVAVDLRRRSPAHVRGLMWNDAALGIAWPLSADWAIPSERDGNDPELADLPNLF